MGDKKRTQRVPENGEKKEIEEYLGLLREKNIDVAEALAWLCENFSRLVLKYPGTVNKVVYSVFDAIRVQLHAKEQCADISDCNLQSLIMVDVAEEEHVDPDTVAMWYTGQLCLASLWARYLDEKGIERVRGKDELQQKCILIKHYLWTRINTARYEEYHRKMYLHDEGSHLAVGNSREMARKKGENYTPAGMRTGWEEEDVFIVDEREDNGNRGQTTKNAKDIAQAIFEKMDSVKEKEKIFIRPDFTHVAIGAWIEDGKVYLTIRYKTAE